MMFLHRTNILPAGEDSKQKVATCFYLIFHDSKHFSNNIWTAKSARQPVVGEMFPTFWSPPPCPDNQNDFFSSIILYFVCFFLQIATWTILLIHHCVEISIILCSISKSTLPWTAVHDYETKNEYSSNRHSSNQSTIQRKH